MAKATSKNKTLNKPAAIKTTGKSAPAKQSASRTGTTSRDVDKFLAAQPDDVRAALEKLRRDIQAAAPDATELISYGVPTFKMDKPFASYWATKTHCAFNLRGTDVVTMYADELRDYNASGGTVRFPASKPLPSALVKKLVKARMALNNPSRVKRK